jgi:uncharacterized membrane protein
MVKYNYIVKTIILYKYKGGSSVKYKLHKFKNIISLKENSFLKLYLLILFMLNFTYICLVLYNFKLKKLFSSLGSNSLFLIKETYPLEFIKSINISKINDIIYCLIIGINLFCLIILINKKLSTKFNINTKQFLITHYIYLLFIFLANYVFSIIFSAPIGNLTAQLFPACIITLAVSICYILKILYKKIQQLD